jgi:hypothetical protein
MDNNYINNLFRFSSTVSYSVKNIYDFAMVSEFLSSYCDISVLENINVYLFSGVLHKSGNKVYALYYDGDETDLDFEVLQDGFFHKVRIDLNHPCILVSSEILNDEVFLDTTLVHEYVHFLDNVSSGEFLAKNLENTFLVDMYGYSEDASYEFLLNKYNE